MYEEKEGYWTALLRQLKINRKATIDAALKVREYIACNITDCFSRDHRGKIADFHLYPLGYSDVTKALINIGSKCFYN